MNVETVLETARAEIGYHEGSNNSNKYGKEYGLNNQPWCVIFLWWCFKHSLDGAVEKLSDFMPNSAHCNGVRSFALKIDRWYPRSEIGLHIDIEAGDLVIWDTNGDNSGDHIGIVESAVSNNNFTTIEGNHSDAVCRVNRNFSNVMGIYKPLYDFDFRAAELNNLSGETNIDKDALQNKHENDTPAASESDTVVSSKELLKLGDIGRTVSVVQYALHIYGYEPSGSRKKNGDYDGEFGEGTSKAVKLFQLDKGLTVTGAIDETTFKALVEGGA